jgi:branched-chain amino acid transport system permease protein
VLMPRGLADLFRHFRAQGWRYFTNNFKSHSL